MNESVKYFVITDNPSSITIQTTIGGCRDYITHNKQDYTKTKMLQIIKDYLLNNCECIGLVSIETNLDNIFFSYSADDVDEITKEIYNLME